MAEDWLADVRKYAPSADESVVSAIVKYCGIALQNKDSSLVSFSDPTETGRLRENYLKKKLGLTHDDATLDASIAAVGERMKGDPTKNRVTVYYLLAEHFGALDIFGGTAKVAPLAAGGAGAAAGAAASSSTVHPAAPVEPVATPQAAYSTYAEEKPGTKGIGRWLPWILLALVALALLYTFRAYMTHSTPEPQPAAAPRMPTVPTRNIPAPAVAIPTGAGVIASEHDSLPMLTVYFQTEMSEVHNDLSAAASGVKNYLDTHPNATLAVSGYNDPTGNAAANAELAKERAENVKAALEKLGISAPRIILVKPAQTTGTGDNNAESRRVEVTVQDK